LASHWSLPLPALSWRLTHLRWTHSARRRARARCHQTSSQPRTLPRQSEFR
jgi:hypothetical protein